jgi:hypothetical protein
VFFNSYIFRNADSLENTAWLGLVKAMKKRDAIKDPYEAARKYLPPNSSIRCPFDRVEDGKPEKKRRKLE